MRNRAIWAIVTVLICGAAAIWVTRWLHAGTAAGALPAVTSTGPVAGTSPPGATPSTTITARTGPTLHYISNTGTDLAPIAGLGYNLFDMGPDKSAIDALGPGRYALVWLGNLDNTNCTPGFSDAQFKAAVTALAHDPHVYGYYLSDEPHPIICPLAAQHLRARADLIHALDPSQKAFAVVEDATRSCPNDPGCEYRELKPSITHLDLIGIDPFACHVQTGCMPDLIDQTVKFAVAEGIPESALVPVIQVFGQSCTTNPTKFYLQPSVAQLRSLLQHWQALVPHPAFDFTYTWRSRGPACPSLDLATGVSGHPDLQAVMAEHNRS